MLAFQTIEYYNKTISLLGNLEEILQFVEIGVPMEQKQYMLESILEARKSEDSTDYIYKISKQKCAKGEFLRKYQESFEKFSNEFRFLEFYRLVSIVELEYRKICDEYDFVDASVSNFIAELNFVSQLHENLVRGSYKNTDKVIFFEKMEKISIAYKVLIQSINCYISSISNCENFPLENDEMNLDIQLLNVNYCVKDFYEILGNIDDAYSVIGMICPENKNMLKIRKIESGSLLADIFGNQIIIAISIYLIEKIIDIVYKKFSDSGKIDLVAKEINTIVQSGETMQKLEDLGIKVDENNKKMISECLTSAISKLHKVIVKAPKIKVNGEVHCVTDTKLYIECSQKFLENSNIEEK